MKRLGKPSELSIIMEGNVGKVMKAGKLLERVKFEDGDNLVEAVNKLKKDHLLEVKVSGFTVEGLGQVLDEIGKVPYNCSVRIKGEFAEELIVDVKAISGGDRKVIIADKENYKGFYMIFDSSVSVSELVDYLNGDGNFRKVANAYSTAGPV